MITELEFESRKNLLRLYRQRHVVAFHQHGKAMVYPGGTVGISIETKAARRTLRTWFQTAGAVVVHMWRNEDGDWRVIFRPACLPALRKFVYPVKAA